MLPDTPAGRAARWYLEVLASGAEGLTAKELAERVAPSMLAGEPELADPAEWQRWWREWFSVNVGTSSVEKVEESSDAEITVRLAGPTRAWNLTIGVEDVPPHRMRSHGVRRSTPAGVAVREATAEDAAALVELERKTAMGLGGTLVTFDHREDFFAWTRLVEPLLIAVAEVDGTIGGVNCGAVRRCIVDGTEHTLSTAFHLRVAPEHQRRGVWSAINPLLWEFYDRHGAPSSYVFVSSRNEVSQASFANHENKWGLGVHRAILRCGELAGPAFGRRATPDDCEQVVSLLNETHGKEEMYFPYTVESFAARMERAPDLYSWDQVWLADGAVVGVWPGHVYVTRERAGVRTTDVRAHVLDYGFAPGASAHLEALLRARCADLAAQGHSELTMFTSEPSRGYELVRDLGSDMERFDFWNFAIPEPEGAAARGLYVDQACF